MLRKLWPVLLVCSLWAAPALANAPAPWWACEGKAAGDSCDLYPSGTGICVEQASCTDDTGTAVNECLHCESDPDKGCQTATSPGVLLALIAMAGLAFFRRRSSLT